jgi:putative ABC transport system permease protein
MAFLVVGLMIGVATVVSLFSLSSSMRADVQHKMENFGANILVTPIRNDLALNYGGIALGGVTAQATELMQADLVKLDSIPNAKNISVVAPKLIGVATVAGEQVMVMGIDPSVEFRLKQWWTINGSKIGSLQDVVVGSQVARAFALNVGTTIQINNRPFTVTGIIEPTGSQDDDLILVSLPVAQTMLDKQGQLSFVEVAALCGDCPVDDMVKQISAVLPAAQVNAIQQVVKTRMHALQQFETFSLAVSVIVLFIGSMVVFVTMMGSVNERCHEIGIFRALGFRKHHIVKLILMEAVLVSLVAGIAGYLFGMAAATGLLPWVADVKAQIVWDPAMAFGALVVAVVIGAIATIYPALHASRLDPADALRTL